MQIEDRFLRRKPARNPAKSWIMTPNPGTLTRLELPLDVHTGQSAER